MQAVIYVLLIMLGFVTLYPFWNSLVISFNVGSDTALGGVGIWPRAFTLENYYIVLQDTRLLKALLVTVSRTVAGTALSIFFTALLAYGMSKRELIGKKFYVLFTIFTLYFSGGLIPFYLLCRALGLMDTFWVMIIPGVISVYNMIIFRTFFMGLPDGLEESAKIDGCSHFGVFFRIVVPVSGAVIATLSLFTAVFHWNDWFGPTIFIQNPNLIPIQTLLTQIVNSNAMTEQLQSITGGNAAAMDELQRARTITSKSLTMATMMVATIPIVLIYPFIQRHFIKGVLIGSLKG